MQWARFYGYWVFFLIPSLTLGRSSPKPHASLSCLKQFFIFVTCLDWDQGLIHRVKLAYPDVGSSAGERQHHAMNLCLMSNFAVFDFKLKS